MNKLIVRDFLPDSRCLAYLSDEVANIDPVSTYSDEGGVRLLLDEDLVVDL